MRKSQADKLDEQFIQRWSPRSFAEGEVADDDLLAMFEAARWAPSCFNEQPWLFLYADAEPHLTLFRDLLLEGNQSWAKRAPVLVAVAAKQHFDRNAKENVVADFDAGSAFMSFVLQAHNLGYASHAMQGFDKERAYGALNLDRAKFHILCFVAVGKRGSADILPSDLQAREKPSDRKTQKDFVKRGRY